MPTSSTLNGFDDRLWSKFDPEAFERFCFQTLALQNPGRPFEKTRYSGDGGVDIVSNKQSGAYDLFGFRVLERTNLLIEAKRRKSVDLHDCARSVIAAAADRECRHFALITTAAINVRTYFEIAELCALHRIDFIYIHRDIIARTLIKCPELAERFGFSDEVQNWDKIVRQPLPPLTCHWAFSKTSNVSGRVLQQPIVATAKRRDLLFQPNERLKLWAILENSGDSCCELRVEVVGLDRWRGLQLATRLDVLPPRNVRGLSFVFELTARTAVPLPNVYVEAIPGSAPAIRLTISADKLYALPFFESPLVGKAALLQKQELSNFAREFVSPVRQGERILEWMLVEGKAGVGKSRLIEEALIKPFNQEDGATNIVVMRYFVQRNGSVRTIAEVLRGLVQYCRLGVSDNIRSAIQRLHQDGLTDEILAACAAPFAKPPTAPLLIVLEDLHHGSDDLFRWLRAVHEVTKHLSLTGSIYRFCITGRNDDTFPNPRQDAFWALLRRDFSERDIEEHRFLQVVPLDSDDAQTLVHSIFNGITTTACQRIVALSESVPFNILQVIEYLCEESLVEISERRTYSIKDEKRFYTKLGRPNSMADLFSLRLRRLTRRPGGAKLVQLLQVLSLLGLNCATEFFDSFADYLGIDESRWELFRTGYLVREDDQVRFSHENILYFLSTLTMRSARSAKVAGLIVSRPDILQTLEPWRRCRIAHLAGHNDLARVIITQVVGDGSVAHLCSGGGLSEKRQILEAGIRVWSCTASDRDSILYLLNLYFLWAFSSKYTRNYGETIRDGLETLTAIGADRRFVDLLDAEELDVACAKVEQIVGHAYQNAGDLDRSQYHIQRAQRIVNSYGRDDAGFLDLKFDVEDRLRKNFVLFGESRDAERCFVNARHTAKLKKDNLLLGSALYGEAELYFLQDPDRALQIWSSISSHVALHSDERTKITFELAMCQMELIRAEDETALRRGLDALKVLGDRSLEDGLIGPLPKINLLNAYAYYRLGDPQRAITENLAAYDKAESIGYGVFLWFAQNNLALAQQASASEDVRAILLAFATALNKAEDQGFLRRVVDRPTFFQNALVDNARRFYSRHGLGLQLAELNDRLNRNGIMGTKVAPIDVGSARFRVTHGTYFLFV